MAGNAWLVVAVLLASGCATIRSVRMPTESVADTYEAQCAAAATWAATAEHATNAIQRAAAARRGIVLARRARELNPDGVAGHYYYAINVGWLAEADRSYGLNAVAEMEAALKRAIELDEKYDYAGPLRLLAILHLRTPPPPTSIGSARRAARLLQRATELFPDYPENYLYWAEALRETGQADAARAALAKILNAPPWPGRERESEVWREQARRMRIE